MVQDLTEEAGAIVSWQRLAPRRSVKQVPFHVRPCARRVVPGEQAKACVARERGSGFGVARSFHVATGERAARGLLRDEARA